MNIASLSQVMAIAHYKICMPIRLLAGNTHHMNAVGYDWSAWSVRNVIDVLHDVIVKIEKNRTKFLDRDFMNSIFSKPDTNKKREHLPLNPLVEAMEYFVEEIKFVMPLLQLIIIG